MQIEQATQDLSHIHCYEILREFSILFANLVQGSALAVFQDDEQVISRFGESMILDDVVV